MFQKYGLLKTNILTDTVCAGKVELCANKPALLEANMQEPLKTHCKLFAQQIR